MVENIVEKYAKYALKISEGKISTFSSEELSELKEIIDSNLLQKEKNNLEEKLKESNDTILNITSENLSSLDIDNYFNIEKDKEEKQKKIQIELNKINGLLNGIEKIKEELLGELDQREEIEHKNKITSTKTRNEELQNEIEDLKNKIVSNKNSIEDKQKEKENNQKDIDKYYKELNNVLNDHNTGNLEERKQKAKECVSNILNLQEKNKNINEDIQKLISSSNNYDKKLTTKYTEQKLVTKEVRKIEKSEKNYESLIKDLEKINEKGTLDKLDIKALQSISTIVKNESKLTDKKEAQKLIRQIYKNNKDSFNLKSRESLQCDKLKAKNTLITKAQSVIAKGTLSTIKGIKSAFSKYNLYKERKYLDKVQKYNKKLNRLDPEKYPTTDILDEPSSHTMSA